MPHIEINREEFEQLLGKKVENSKLNEEASYLGVHWNHVEKEKWDVESYPNRPDLLSVEGLARAYSAFFGVDTGLKSYEMDEGNLEIEIDESVEEVRPFIGGAVVKGLELNDRVINGLIQLQEKMHQTMGRRRDKLAIGLHDLSQVEPPFTYRAVKPENVSFTPLEHNEDMHLGEIIDEHEKGQEYSWILDDEDIYPIIEDSQNNVLSFPPIINNQLTEVTGETTDIFIDVTGKDLETVEKALNILTTALAERGGNIETVNVGDQIMPNLSPDEMELDVEYLNSISGLDLQAEEAAKLLRKMGYGAKTTEGKNIEVKAPCYRNDIMHNYDLIEDAVIAYGYDEVEPQKPEIDQIAGEKDIEKFAKIVRETLIGVGALETHTFILSSRKKLFGNMEIQKKPHASMGNALTEDYEVVRNWMLPSLMEALRENRHRPYPQSFFEAGDVVEMPNVENKKKLCYVKAGEIDYTDARQVLQALENSLGIKLDLVEEQKSFAKPKRSANITKEGEEIGFIAELDETVLDNWGLETGVSGFEIDLEKLSKYY